MPGLLARMAAGPTVAEDTRRTPGPASDFWYKPIMAGSAAGIPVTVPNALTVPAVRRAVTVLAGAIAALPLHVFERDGEDKKKAPRHPLYDVIHRQPNGNQSAYRFWESMVANLVLLNACYAEIKPGRRGFADQLIPLRADKVKPMLTKAGALVFDVTRDDGRTDRLLRDEMFYVFGHSLGVLPDPGPLHDGKDTIANAIALSRYVGTQWKNGARLSGVIEHPNKVGEEALKNLRGSWQAMYGGVSNAGKTAILEEGMKFKELSQTNDDAQLYEQWAFLVTEIGRIFGVPSILLGHSDNTSTYASAEQFFLSFVTHSLMPWLVNIQDAINTQLILAPDLYFAEFSVAGLLRGDHEARAAFYKSGIEAGWLTPNEARALENLNGMPGGESLRLPLNTTILGPDGRPIEKT